MRTIDIDGSMSLSHIVLLERKKTGAGFVEVYPNPTTGQVNLLFDAPNNSAMTLNVIDVLGRVLQTRSIQPQVGINQTTVDLSEYSDAVYFIVLQDNNSNRQTILLVKTK